MRKYKLRYFFEYGGGCLWSDDELTRDRFNYSINLEELPLSPMTLSKLRELEDLFQTSLNWDDPLSVSLWTREESIEFERKSKELFILIKRELENEFEISYEQNLT